MGSPSLSSLSELMSCSSSASFLFLIRRRRMRIAAAVKSSTTNNVAPTVAPATTPARPCLCSNDELELKYQEVSWCSSSDAPVAAEKPMVTFSGNFFLRSTIS
ncbi:Os08g0124566 [Oryza sativa Japonica Group]|uniref:Os08g0124566 protein n=1 Tax=Oryza sativa subsp. japonica TaxID=39947 RepID=A0A0P0XBE4_ORYSJ|nr:hypothetical protein EE612_041874 [Oryza sativa]BAT03635.1 Os08g0124566 [Oryza sativa Japonica Group]